MTAKKPPAKRKPPAKPRAPKKVARPLIWRDKPRQKRTAAERKSKAIELALQAFAGGWTIARFCIHSHVGKSTMLRWLAEDTVQPRFLKAMQVKALALPDDASEILRQIINGTIEPKAGGVVLRHLEFRIMREIKSLYQPSRLVQTTTDVSSMTDDQVNAKFEELMDRHEKARAATADADAVPEDDKAAG